MWIKICANTNVKDALKAAELGADAVGFVFAPSKRRVTAAQVRLIAEELPPTVERVGVFAGSTIEEILVTIEKARLTTVQLHDRVDHEFRRLLRDRLPAEISIIQTVHWPVVTGDFEQDGAASEIGNEMAIIAADQAGSRVLIDAKVGAVSGGLGVAFDWRRAREVTQANSSLHVIVAGGLKPDNVAAAIRELEPWGVDVASGVEREPGIKDYDRLKAFLDHARAPRLLI